MSKARLAAEVDEIAKEFCVAVCRECNLHPPNHFAFV